VALEFLAAELEFLFLDFGEPFADGGVAMAEEHGADLLEGFHVFGAVGAGKGEFESGLFEDMDCGFGELGLAGGGELEDLSGGFLGVGGVVEEIFGGGTVGKALNGVFINGALELLGGKPGGFAVGKFVEPLVDLVEVCFGETGEFGKVEFHGFRVCKGLMVWEL
jgi:hypothetical protein